VTVDEWLRTRAPQPPAALSVRLGAVLGESLNRSSQEIPEVFLAAGERLVAELLRSNSTSRDSALDLLTADALVTYAFEAASDTPSAIDAYASAAMTRMAALGAMRPS
jgi:hypothetical protein